jgi:hypothetical protein
MSDWEFRLPGLPSLARQRGQTEPKMPYTVTTGFGSSAPKNGFQLSLRHGSSRIRAGTTCNLVELTLLANGVPDMLRDSCPAGGDQHSTGELQNGAVDRTTLVG